MNEETIRMAITVEVGLYLLREAMEEGLITPAQYQKAAKIYQEIAA